MVCQRLLPESWHMPFSDNRYGSDVTGTRVISGLDPIFPSTREHQLLVDLAEAVEQGDQEMFADKLFQFDQMSKLDKWKTTILLRVKNGIEEKGEDFS
jgi:tRNA(Ile)-lysidine synthase TilS/MesJ